MLWCQYSSVLGKQEVIQMGPSGSVPTSRLLGGDRDCFRLTGKPEVIRSDGLRNQAMTLILQDARCPEDDSYSYRSASIGLRREAFSAGKNPDTIPTKERMVNDTIMTLMEACRKIAPSWSAVL